ncbi:MAG: hypothetical protein KF900_09865 [Bacteroidetes bacterium]|nr:hypothetical protein [Bacteroidota bacterium]
MNVCAGAQKDSLLYLFRSAEQQLMALRQPLFYSRNQAERTEANKEFIEIWETIIENPKVLHYPFDSLKKDVSFLAPKNKNFRLITWDFRKDDGTYLYYGFLLVNNSKRVKVGFLKHKTIEEYETFQLVDKSDNIKSPENYIGSPQRWFGMLYTQLIDCGDFYTLIGWDGNTKLSQRKFVDVLYFRSNGTPVFGKDVFKFPKKNPKRLMFEYSQEVSMSVKYNEKKNQIIYSHLAAREEGAPTEGLFQYYGPDGSFDALVLKKDKWVTVEDIDARQEKSKNDNATKPDPKKQKAIYDPKKKR